MFNILLIISGVLGLVFYAIPASAQVYAEDGYFIQKFIRVKDEATFNVNGSVIGLKYSEITGSPFLKNDYTLADLYKNEKKVATAPVKINLFSNEIYFRKGEEELVLAEQGINEIVFLETGDTTTFIRRVPNLLLNKNKVDDFVQVLNNGSYQLLKYTKKQLGTADSAMNYKRYYFSETNYYFLKKSEKVERIKKLDENNILSYLSLTKTITDWIKANEVNFKKEKDIISFLNYYNAAIQNKN